MRQQFWKLLVVGGASGRGDEARDQSGLGIQTHMTLVPPILLLFHFHRSVRLGHGVLAFFDQLRLRIAQGLALVLASAIGVVIHIGDGVYTLSTI